MPVGARQRPHQRQRRSRWLAAAALLCGMGAFYVVWYSPRNPAAAAVDANKASGESAFKSLFGRAATTGQNGVMALTMLLNATPATPPPTYTPHNVLKPFKEAAPIKAVVSGGASGDFCARRKPQRRVCASALCAALPTRPRRRTHSPRRQRVLLPEGLQKGDRRCHAGAKVAKCIKVDCVGDEAVGGQWTEDSSHPSGSIGASMQRIVDGDMTVGSGWFHEFKVNNRPRSRGQPDARFARR